MNIHKFATLKRAPHSLSPIKNISSKFIDSISYFNIREMTIRNKNLRLLYMSNFPTVYDAVKYLERHFETNLPRNLFVFVMNIKSSLRWGEEFLKTVEQTFKSHVSPIVIVFESSQNERKVLYKNFNKTKFEIIERIDEICAKEFLQILDGKLNFKILLRAFKSKHCGNLGDSFITIKFNIKSSFNHLSMINHAVNHADILCIRFLQLFDIDLDDFNENGDRPLEHAACHDNYVGFYTLIGISSNIEEFQDVKDQRLEETLKLSHKHSQKDLLTIAAETGNYEIVKFLLYCNVLPSTTFYFSMNEKNLKALIGHLEIDCEIHESNAHEMMREYSIAQYVIEKIIINDLNDADEIEINARLKIFWYILRDDSNQHVLKFINSFLKFSHQKVSEKNHERLKEFLKKKCDDMFGTLRKIKKRKADKSKLNDVISHLINVRYFQVLKLILKCFENDVRRFLNIKSSDCTLLCSIVKDDFKCFKEFWSMIVELCGKTHQSKVIKIMLTCKHDKNSSILSEIILKLEDDEESIKWFFKTIENSFEIDEYREFFTCEFIIDYSQEKWNLFEDFSFSLIQSALNPIETYRIFFDAVKMVLNKQSKIELCAKIIKQIRYEFNSDLWLEILIGIFKAIDNDDEIQEIFLRKNKFRELILHQISWLANEKLLSELFAIIQNKLTVHQQNFLLFHDENHKIPLMKACYARKVKNVKIFWNFIDKVFDKNMVKKREYLEHEDNDGWNSLHYAMIQPQTSEEFSLKYILEIYEKIFTREEMKSMILKKFSNTDTIIFPCMQKWSKINEDFITYMLKICTIGEIQEFFHHRNRNGFSAFCVRDTSNENRQLIQSQKFLNDFVERNFQNGAIEDLIAPKLLCTLISKKKY